MLKPPTGEPCAGEPHARFGGRGGLKLFPTPIIPPALLVVADYGLLDGIFALFQENYLIRMSEKFLVKDTALE
mgnify:CR=1 FL=1